MFGKIKKIITTAAVLAMLVLPNAPTLAQTAPSRPAAPPAADTGPGAVNDLARYCVKDNLCKPNDPIEGCGEGWDPAPSCPCPGDARRDCVPLENPLKGDVVGLFPILGTIISVALGIIGSLTLLMLVWGGFQWLTSGGNPERIKKGTDTMLWAAVGVFCVFASYFILSNFIDYLTGNDEVEAPASSSGVPPSGGTTP